MGLRDRIADRLGSGGALDRPDDGTSPAAGLGDTGGRLADVAVVTMVRDEGVMLPRWVSYYAGQVGAENLLVVDDNSVDGSTDDLPCPVLRIPPLRKKQFEAARMGMLSSLSAGLLEAYDAVIFCDADEFIVADPDRHQSLRHFVTARPGHHALAGFGFNVVHDLGHEPDLDPAAPVLGQRRLAKLVPLMCKPSLKWVPAGWVDASHGIRASYEFDPDLFMFHLKFADRGLLQAAADHRLAMVRMDGRAESTSWSKGGDAMVSLLEEITRGVSADEVSEFVVPPKAETDALVTHERDRGVWRAPRGGQVPMMRQRPFVRIPTRFHGLL